MFFRRCDTRKPTLYHSNPAICLVRNLCLATETHDLRVIHHTRGHARQRIGEYLGICIDTQHELVFIRAHAGAAPNRVEKLILKRRHPLVEHDLLQESHKHQLRIALASVPAFGVLLLEWVADFGDKDYGHFLLLGGLDCVRIIFVEPGVHLGHVVPLVAVCDSDVRVRLNLVNGDNKVLHHAQDNFGRVHVVAGPLHHAISDDKDDLVAVRVVRRGERVERRAETFN